MILYCISVLASIYKCKWLIWDHFGFGQVQLAFRISSYHDLDFFARTWRPSSNTQSILKIGKTILYSPSQPGDKNWPTLVIMLQQHQTMVSSLGYPTRYSSQHVDKIIMS